MNRLLNWLNLFLQILIMMKPGYFLGDRALKAYQLAIGQLIDFYQTQQKDSIKKSKYFCGQNKVNQLPCVLGVLESKKAKELRYSFDASR